jgi:CheY-like chemotaxis protein
MKGDRERCLETGMDDYVAKPLQPVELFDTVERLTTAMDGVPRATAAESIAVSATCTGPAGQPPPNRQASPPPPDSPSDFDKAAAIEQVGGDEQLLKELLAAFLSEYPPLMAQIRDAIAQRDARSLERTRPHAEGRRGGAGRICPLPMRRNVSKSWAGPANSPAPNRSARNWRPR